MATQLQIRRGTTAQMNAFTGAEGELAVNTSTDTVHVHDGATAGGFALAKADGSNIGTYAGSFTTLAASGAVTLSSTLAVTGQTIISSNALVSTPSTYYDELVVQNSASGTGAGMTILVNATNGFGGVKFGDSSNSNRFGIGFDANANAGFLDVLGAQVLTIDGATRNVGIGTSSPSYLVHADATTSTDPSYFVASSGSDFVVAMGSQNSPGVAQEAFIGTISNDTLKIKTNNTERMRIDASGRVGIGTSSPAAPLDIKLAGTGTADIFKFQRSDGAVAGVLNYNGTDGAISLGTTTAHPLAFDTNNVERMRIDSSGNVGIGTDTIIGSAANRGVLTLSGASSSFLTFGTGSTRWGGVYSSASSTIFLSDSISTFETGGVERIRLDSNGSLLVGKTAADSIGTDGIELDGANDRLMITRNNNEPLVLNRRSSDGDIAIFRKDGAAVGSISSRTGSSLIISSAGNSAGFHFGGAEVNPVKNGALSDNTIDLGQASYRYDDIYATNGTIQTSDRNEKQDIAELSDAEQRVALACKGLLRKFRWIDAVEAKGDDARIHFGIIAQDLQAAFEAEGLDAARYAMFISTTWTDEDTGQERTRLGVRYSELLAFIISAI
ncbi:tail fiber domain-containing protein [Paracoccaceae bacterium]|nr:tail fiber domain-containing protein [Euryarchaeota archaeon]MDB2599025.1 tail fiber domain-containing protein [Paracoccaceae bacterium]